MELLKAILLGIKDDALEEVLRWNLYIIIATIPAVLVGFTLRNPIEKLFDNVFLVLGMIWYFFK